MNLDKKYIDGQCTKPVTIDWRNPLTGLNEKRDVPCGNCWHCRLTKVNEWYTRMYLNSAYRKHTYFITLTYDSERMTEQELIETCACVHPINYKHEEQLSPLTLCKRHVQLFFKRLRKKYPDEQFQYYLVGEYGHKYGRPHYHMILWTDEVYSAENIEDIWHMGHVDFDCLDKEICDCTNKSFGYVCKYLMKDFDYKQIKTLKYHEKNFYSQNPKEYYFYQNQKQNCLEMDESQDFNLKLYFRKYGGFMCCSKKHAIGSGYLQSHMDKFRKGDLRLFGIHDEHFVFPTYFARKARQTCCPVSLLSTTNKKPLSAVSATELQTYVMELCSDINNHESLLQTIEQNGDFTSSLGSEVFKRNINTLVKSDFYDSSTQTYYLLEWWKVPSKELDPLMDMPLKNEFVLCYSKYRYNRSTRTYVNVGVASIPSVRQRLKRLVDDLKKYFIIPYYQSYHARQEEKRAYIEAYHQGDVTSYKQTIAELSSLYEQVRKDKQQKYLLTKNVF